MTPTWMAHAYPVSVKGLAMQDGRVLLLENERMEWELPGGKLELSEDPSACVIREISEEADWQVTAGPVLDCWQYHISDGQDVVIVTYGLLRGLYHPAGGQQQAQTGRPVHPWRDRGPEHAKHCQLYLGYTAETRSRGHAEEDPAGLGNSGGGAPYSRCLPG